MSDDEQKKDETTEETPVQDESPVAAGAAESEGPAGGDEVSGLGPTDSTRGRGARG
jgi:hypothetical protein